MSIKTISTIFLISIVSAEHLRYEVKLEPDSESETIVNILKTLTEKIDGIIVQIEDTLKNLSEVQLIEELEDLLIELLTAFNTAVNQQQKLNFLLEATTKQINDVLAKLKTLSTNTETVNQLIEPLLSSLKSLSSILKSLAEVGVGVIENGIIGGKKLYIKKNE
jgi:methyl-accepting chemotaxis protein